MATRMATKEPNRVFSKRRRSIILEYDLLYPKEY
jgi:hypothetical protein